MLFIVIINTYTRDGTDILSFSKAYFACWFLPCQRFLLFIHNERRLISKIDCLHLKSILFRLIKHNSIYIKKRALKIKKL